jgi:beta-lactamase regulating signal transducer with metallopeptidase domain
MTASLQPIFEALAFSLLHFVWQGAVVAAGYKLIDIALPKLRPQFQYVIALAALLTMAFVGAATFVYEYLRVFRPDPIAAGLVITPTSHPSIILTVAPFLDALWLLGVAALSGCMLVDLWKIQCLAMTSSPVPSPVAQSLGRLMDRTGFRRSVRIRLHPLISGPIVVGFLRSVIYLPLSTVSALTPDQLDTVLAHELEHIRRADYAWNVVQTIIETLFFFHPAVWWIGGKLRAQRELCCDDAAVAVCNDPIVYATALLSLEKQYKAAPSLAMTMSGRRQGLSLLSRVSRVLGEAPAAEGRGSPVYAAVMLPLLMVVMLAALTPATQVIAHTKTAPAAPAEQETPAIVAEPAAQASAPLRPRTARQSRHATAAKAEVEFPDRAPAEAKAAPATAADPTPAADAVSAAVTERPAPPAPPAPAAPATPAAPARPAAATTS